jgi:hypothetical protein
MMGGVSPETCCASFKIRNNKNVDALLHLVGFFTVRINTASLTKTYFHSTDTMNSDPHSGHPTYL